MLFVDGENLTIRGQKVAADNTLTLKEGPYFKKDCLIWLPNVNAIQAVIASPNQLQYCALRAYYYTSLVGDEPTIDSSRKQLRELGFDPQVFKRDSEQKKAKGVDIALTKDMLSHAFRNNYEAAVLVAGDGDYVPLVEEVKRLGKLVYVLFFADQGLHPKLQMAADLFYNLAPSFVANWESYVGRVAR